jgi:hypothetical protein
LIDKVLLSIGGRIAGMFGGVLRHHMSNAEHGCRSIGLKMARKLSSLLGAPIEKFIEMYE